MADNHYEEDIPAQLELQALNQDSIEHSNNIDVSFRGQQRRLANILTAVRPNPVPGVIRLDSQYELVRKTFVDLRALSQSLTRSITGYLAELEADRLEMHEELDENIPEPPTSSGEETPPHNPEVTSPYSLRPRRPIVYAGFPSPPDHERSRRPHITTRRVVGRVVDGEVSGGEEER
jgi:hypothetical protein